MTLGGQSPIPTGTLQGIRFRFRHFRWSIAQGYRTDDPAGTALDAALTGTGEGLSITRRYRMDQDAA